MKYIIGILGLLIAGLGMWHFSKQAQSPTVNPVQKNETAETITVSASIYPLAYITDRIMGSQGTVHNIGGNSDPHDFRPSAQDIRTMQDSDLVIIQGAELEPWGEEITEQLQNNGVAVLIASEQTSLHPMAEEHHEHDDHAEAEHGHHEEEGHDAEHDEHTEEHADHGEDEEHGEHDHHHGEFDPHTWLDPVLLQEIAESISNKLSQLDPANAQVYQQNLNQVKADLSQVDKEYSTNLANCAVDEVITSHDAFGYLARRYGFTIHSIAGLSTQDTPSAVTMAQLKEEAAEGIQAILLEENSVSAYGETLARETSLQTLPISPIVSIKQGDDYLTVARSNLRTLETALGCNE